MGQLKATVQTLGVERAKQQMRVANLPAGCPAGNQMNQFTNESVGDEDSAPIPIDATIRLDGENRAIWLAIGLQQRSWVSKWRRLVDRRGRVLTEGLMRSLVVVALAKQVEGTLLRPWIGPDG